MLPHQILSPADGSAAEIVNAGGRSDIVLVCEHASAMIPVSLENLGLNPADRESHAVWDPGAAALALRLSELLDAPLLLGRISRLVHDCNRPPDRADAMPARTETIEIPGNRDLTAAERQARTREVYEPFHASLSAVLDSVSTPPALVTIHSFSPVWFGKRRETRIGLLHDTDPKMAQAMLRAAPEGVEVVLNEPYSAADGVTHLLKKHGTARGLSSVMIEVRNDLLTTKDAVEKIAATLHAMILAAMTELETA